MNKMLERGMDPTLRREHIIVCHNPAWERSFGNVEWTLNVTAERGWHWCTHNLLDHPALKNTRTYVDEEHIPSFGGKYYQQSNADSPIARSDQEKLPLALYQPDHPHPTTAALMVL